MLTGGKQSLPGPEHWHPRRQREGRADRGVLAGRSYTGPRAGHLLGQADTRARQRLRLHIELF